MLFAGRFPSEKAAAIFLDLSARSFVARGSRVTVLAPRRFLRGQLKDAPYQVVYLPVIDLSRIPVLWSLSNYISVACFSIASFLYLALCSHTEDVVMSNDVVPLTLATSIRNKTLYEMHDYPDRSLWMYAHLFKRVSYILATNAWKAQRIREDFSVSESNIIIERNGVDVHVFGGRDTKAARESLRLSPKGMMVVYTGHLYEWKGVHTLAEAAKDLEDCDVYIVGGTPQDVSRFRTEYGSAKNIHIVGHVDHADIPLWQSAADVLVLPNTAHEEISSHYTSPMKLFEYLASERPIVASDLPSIREILPDTIGYYSAPDSASALTIAIRQAIADPEARDRARRGRDLVAQYEWGMRAERILGRIV